MIFADLKRTLDWVWVELQIEIWLFWVNGTGFFPKNNTSFGLPSSVVNMAYLE